MNMHLIILFAVLMIALLIAIKILKAQPTPKTQEIEDDYPYQLSNQLLTRAERSFYGVLSQTIGNEWLIFSKVRVADVIKPQKGLSRSQWQSSFNSIASKHFDFVICDPKDTSFKFAVELDDSSHSKQNQKTRDHFINNACKASGLPLLRVKASKGYVVESLKNEISLLLGLPKERYALGKFIRTESPNSIQAEPKVEITSPPLDSVAENGSEELTKTILCPKCGANMVLRIAKKGKNAGQEFWGCSEFPKCRYVAPLKTTDI